MDEISKVVKDYYAVIGQKDADIFQLYEENKRMKKRLNEVLAKKEEKEIELRTVKLLLMTLQTELREKQLLIEAHQAESAAFRNAELHLRAELHMPSELDYTIDDVVCACVGFRDECLEQRVQLERLASAVRGTWSLAQRTLVETEQFVRGAVDDACCCVCAALVHLQRWTRGAVAEAGRVRCAGAEREQKLREQVELFAGRARVEREQQERLAAEWNAQAACADERLRVLQRCLMNAMAEKELLLDAACTRLNITMERGADAERMLMLALSDAARHNSQLQSARLEAATFRGKLEEALSDLSHTRALLQRHQQRPGTHGGDANSSVDECKKCDDDDEREGRCCDEKKKNRKSRSNGDSNCNKAANNSNTNFYDSFCAMQMENSALKAAWHERAERERLTRQHTATKINKLTAELFAAKQTITEYKRRYDRKEKALQRTQLEVKRHAKEARRLQGMCDVLHAKVKSYEEQIVSFEEVNHINKEENRSLRSHLETLQRMNLELENELASMESSAHSQLVELKQQLCNEKKKFMTELNEWMTSFEETRKKLDVAERERDHERMLRDMLLEQHRDEERMLKKICEEDKNDAVRELRAKVDTLEAACRRGAAVIAELRETLHRAKTEIKSS